MYKKILGVILLFSFAVYGQVKILKPSQEHATSFAIVVDEATYNKTNGAVDAYKEAVENDGLSAYILVSDWQDPQAIKDELVKLAGQEPPLEGAVFIGDIPIPMVKNAQYMTSAFKLDEFKYPIERASVPSDRFYDDFDLKFEFTNRDTANELYFYYSLEPESNQRIEKDIYSGRIKAPVADDSKYEMIEKYLQKVVNQKKNPVKLDNMFVYTGHGYYSNSLDAWADERLSLQEQFPLMYTTKGKLRNFHHSMDDNLKEILLTELSRPELDMAIFHAHGSVELQYIIDYPEGGNAKAKLEDVKLFLRSKLRSAKRRGNDLEEAKKYYIENYGVTDSFFEGAFEDSVIKADSILEYTLDIYSQDIAGISPQAEFVVFDECFNGSFHQPEYISGRYIFNDGATIAGEANSVNVLQDKWPDEYMGLIAKGVRIGNWHRMRNLLESHIIGDPTFRYSNGNKYDLDSKLVFDRENKDVWEKLIGSDDPVIRSLAVTFIYNSEGKAAEDKLEKIYYNDPSVNVRLHALKNLAAINGEGFHRALKVSINDPYELIRRFTSTWMGEVGEEDYIPLLADVLLHDESSRVGFSARNSISFIDPEIAIEKVQEAIDALPEPANKERIAGSLVRSMNRNREWLYDELIPNITSDTLKEKYRLSELRTFRNYRFHDGVPTLIELGKDTQESEIVRLYAIEALGWFNLSNRHDMIVAACNEIIENKDNSEAVRNEALRTKNRLLTGLNNPVLP